MASGNLAQVSSVPNVSSPLRPGGGLGVPIPSLHNIKENEEVPTTRFDVYETYARILNNEDVSCFKFSRLASLIKIVDADATSCRTSPHRTYWAF